MQSVACADTALRYDRHFANPSVGRANFPPEKTAGLGPPVFIKRFGATARTASAAHLIWRAVPQGTARLTVFISVSARRKRTPMNSPLRSARSPIRPRETGFDEGCLN
ncbi:hypothetical protein [Burkholderia sp. Ac-20379]|uniref:hypothetical protein n=1 Tax=Burkholderia sp. Ac-20379 TaxID=2703900 RepID=UPI001D4D506C|nr:hypothetical protein [Burkholderia sp. Ac-20379]MBN3725986.1 hypothetical protein [Burkholderia sp. Ac-20379]